MRKILEHCPTCGDHLIASQLSCTTCETVIQGRYEPCIFCRLSPQDLAFLEVFVMNRGNVKEMERELGISYWSIRNRLDEVVEQIGFETPDPAPEAKGSTARREILAQMGRGEITVAEAAQRLSRSEL